MDVSKLLPEKPNRYVLNGNTYLNIDELIDYNLDRYNCIKYIYKDNIEKCEKLSNEILSDKFVSTEKKQSFINLAFKNYILEFNIKALKKEFQDLVKHKRNGLQYLSLDVEA